MVSHASTTVRLKTRLTLDIMFEHSYYSTWLALERYTSWVWQLTLEPRQHDHDTDSVAIDVLNPTFLKIY